jgi:hypothetical protein
MARSGLWAGDKTVFKDNLTGKYETYENRKLVELNDELVKLADINFESKTYYDATARDKFDNMYSLIDATKYNAFLDECNSHSPWIWKDPRLFLTIGYWKNLIDPNKTKIIVLYRNTYELWKSQAIKRIIYSYNYLKFSEENARHELTRYLETNNLSYTTLEYDQFCRDPSTSINKINDLLGSELTKEKWDDIYRPTSRLSNYKRTLLAYLIYIKNYNSRIK